jgi:hypothetical protein
LDDSKLDKAFLESDEFTSLLLGTLARNAQVHEKEKTRLYARLFVNAAKLGNSSVPYKEGFLQIIDQLSVAHIHILSLIHQKSLAFTDEDRQNNRDGITAEEIALETGVSVDRVQAYCEQMIRFGLLRDWGIGRYGYRPGSYEMTTYGHDFARFLEEQS